MALVKVCQNCGKTFKTYPSEDKKFCSRECYVTSPIFRELRKAKNKPTNLFNPSMSYLIGVYHGDGSVGTCISGKYKGRVYKRYRFRVKVTSLPFLKSVANALSELKLNYYFSTYPPAKKEHKCAHEVCCYSWYLCKWLESLTFQEVAAYLTTDNMKTEYIRGIYESEGSITGYLLRVTTSINSEEIRLVKELLENWNFKIYIGREREGNGIMYIDLLGGRQEKKRFLKLINPCIKNEINTKKYNSWWNNEEVAFLRHNAGKLKVWDIANELNRSTRSVRDKAHRIGVYFSKA